MMDDGFDSDFGRKLMLEPIGKGPYYCVELSPTMLNTQGGPRRNENAEIVRPDGSPIKRLYSSGELGSIYSNLYQEQEISAVPSLWAYCRSQCSRSFALGLNF